MHNAGPCIVSKSNVLFGVKSEYKCNAKWLLIRNYLLAMITHGIIPYDIETAMADLIHIDTAFKLQCNTSMIELEDGSIIYSIRVFTSQRNKKEDKMFASLKRAKYLLLRGSFAIFRIKNGDIECIKVHPGMIKFENNAYTDARSIENIKFAYEKVDGTNMNVGSVKIKINDKYYYVLEVGNKDDDPCITLIPVKNYISEMNIASQMLRSCASASYAPYIVFNVLTTLMTKKPKLMDWMTQYTCVFELLNRRMFEIYMGSEFEKLKTPELVLLRTFKSGIDVSIPVKMKSVFRTPKLFVIGSDDYNNYMSSMCEGVVGLSEDGIPIVKNKTPSFVFFQIMSKLFEKKHTVLNDLTSQDEFYNKIVELVMMKCHCEGGNPIQAKQFYTDYAAMMSLIVYKIACEFRDGNFTIVDNWGNIISSVIKYYADTLDIDSSFMKCYSRFV